MAPHFEIEETHSNLGLYHQPDTDFANYCHCRIKTFVKENPEMKSKIIEVADEDGPVCDIHKNRY